MSDTSSSTARRITLFISCLLAAAAVAVLAFQVWTHYPEDSGTYGTSVQPAQPTITQSRVEPLFGMRGYATKHYTIYTQLTDETTFDIARRLEALYEYYAKRFSEVYYPINFPKVVFLMNNRADFIAAGGHKFMPGQFMGGVGDHYGARLMLIFHEDNIPAFISSCSLLYHEAFHQFASIEIEQAGNINRNWPLWLDESYSTYFNNIAWTGDGWVDGNIRTEYATSAASSVGSFIPLRKLLDITGTNWHKLTDQGKIWPIYMEGMSLIYFLNHAEDSKYHNLLADYVRAVSTGQDRGAASGKIIALQAEFNQWFKNNMNPHITGAKYYEIFTAMAASHLARAHARGQKFESGEDFLAKAQAKQLLLPDKDDPEWLPDTLRQEMLLYHDNLTKSNQPFEFDIKYPADGGTPIVHLYQPRFGLELDGVFELDANGKVLGVSVQYVRCPSLNLVEAKRVISSSD